MSKIQIPPAPERRLWLLRHAKAEYYDSQGTDFDRALSERGIADATLMAEKLAEAGLKAETIISSPAKRAHSTAKAFADALGAKSIVIDERIYEGSAETLLRVVREIADKHHSALFVGHNPGISDLAFELWTGFDSGLPTCGILGLDFNVLSWDAVKSGSASLALHLTPKTLEQ